MRALQKRAGIHLAFTCDDQQMSDMMAFLGVRSVRAASEDLMPMPWVSRLMPARWRGLLAGFLNPYRPEQHYMRGPGPKWLAKHGAKLAG
jgi:hypothetical protein